MTLLRLFCLLICYHFCVNSQPHPHNPHLVRRPYHKKPPTQKVEHQWLYMGARGWDSQFKQGVWDYLKTTPVERARIALIASVLMPSYGPSNGTILDVGCAEGVLTQYLPLELKNNYIGLDISQVAISRARESHKDASYTWVAESCHTYTPPHYLDFILFSEMLMYVEHEKIIRQYESYLNPDGKIIISFFLKDVKAAAVFNFTRRHLELVDTYQVGGIADKRWVETRIDVYRSKKSLD